MTLNHYYSHFFKIKGKVFNLSTYCDNGLNITARKINLYHLELIHEQI